MAKSRSKTESGERLSVAEITLLERLVDRGALITVPALKSQKRRKVVAAALAEHGSQVLLYLSAKPTDGKR